MDKFSYSLGVLVAQNLVKQGITDLKADSLAAAITDVVGNQPLKITAEEADQFVQQTLRKKAASQFAHVMEEGKAFLAKNGQRSEVTTLQSGLQYEVLTEGTGAKPNATDKVTTHYHGTLIDGTIFDSSVQRNEPATFPVNGVIPGWVEALQLMNTGSKWKLFVPPHLAYGDQGAGQVIKPYSTLVFEVELLAIN